VELLNNRFKTATLSRGYKRKTQGFAIADQNSTALDIGDEPMQFHMKFPDLTVAVGEERLVAIPQLLHERPDVKVIILDDAYQHRSVKAGLNILLTEHQNLFTRDLPIPAGDLRDIKSGSKRADVIVITKCKANITEQDRLAITKEVTAGRDQEVIFTEVVYGDAYHLFNLSKFAPGPTTDCLLVCGIANPRPLMEHLAATVKSYDMLRFADHHIFSTDDLRDIKKQFEKINSTNKIVLTTEKDAVRLLKYRKELETFPIYVIPIRHRFLFNEAEKFESRVLEFVNKFPNQRTDFAS
jgi:tetraacyldisaccharide 4'-kinase